MDILIVVDLAGYGYVTFSNATVTGSNGVDEEVWVASPRRPPYMNRAEKDRRVERWMGEHPEGRIVEHTDFYGRLPDGCSGRVL